MARTDDDDTTASWPKGWGGVYTVKALVVGTPRRASHAATMRKPNRTEPRRATWPSSPRLGKGFC
jgi:hypothetical protein